MLCGRSASGVWIGGYDPPEAAFRRRPPGLRKYARAGLLDFQVAVEGDSLRVAVRLTPQGSLESVRAALDGLGREVHVQEGKEIRYAGKRTIARA